MNGTNIKLGVAGPGMQSHSLLSEQESNLHEAISRAFEVVQTLQKAIRSQRRAESCTAYNIAPSPKQQLATKRLASGGTTLAASLGIETVGGISTRLIKAGVPLPCRISEIFSTATDNQPGVEIHVLQGERALARDNKTIGKFHLTDLLPAPRGVPQIEVTFDVDGNGLLHVSAKDLGTGKEQKIIVNSASALTNQEVEDLRRDAEAHANEDRRQSDQITLRNTADSALYRSAKMLRENVNKIARPAKTIIENAMNAVEAALKGTDVSAIHSTTQQLDEAWQAISAELYRRSPDR